MREPGPVGRSAGLGEFAATEAKARRLRAIATPWPSPRRSPCARSPLTVTPAWRAWPFRAGRRADAGEPLATATAMCRGMGMTYWLQKLARDTSAFA